MRHLIYGIVNEREGYGYVNVAKAACTAIKCAIADHVGQPFETVQRCRPWRVDAAFIQARRDLWWFTFVRNPFARLVSAWADFIGGDWVPARRPKELMHNRDLLQYQGWTFGRFVREALRPDGVMRTNPHFAPQCDQLRVSETTDFLMNDYWKMEDLPGAWAQVQDKICLGPLLYARQSQHNPYQDYYTDELREIVADRYRIDFAAFEFDYEELSCASA